MYADCRYGQLHLRSAFPPNGGFDELTTLVCLGAGPATGRIFGGLLGRMGTDRSVYAPDLPGFGESDPPTAQPSIEGHAVAIGDFIDHMRLRKLDLLGYQGGASIAAALAAARPDQVRRVVMVAAPAFDAAGDLAGAARTAARRNDDLLHPVVVHIDHVHVGCAVDRDPARRRQLVGAVSFPRRAAKETASVTAEQGRRFGGAGRPLLHPVVAGVGDVERAVVGDLDVERGGHAVLVADMVEHPTTGETLRFVSPVPQDMEDMLASLH